MYLDEFSIIPRLLIFQYYFGLLVAMGYDYTFVFSWIRPDEKLIGLSNCTATLFGSNISLII